jgi:hypothetical protein
MNKSLLRRWLGVLMVSASLAWASAPAQADPPSRVVRLALVDGSISFVPAGSDDWVRASLNRPLVTGDRLWADNAARAELRLGDIAMRLGEQTSVTLLNVDDSIAQLELSQGTLILRVRSFDRRQPIEIDTPNLAYRVTRAGIYRIEVDPAGAWTEITVRQGAGEVHGDGRSFVLQSGRSYRFHGDDLRDHETVALTPPDGFERWSVARDRRWDGSVSARYVSRELIGYEDLDDHGRWRSVPQYGAVWIPDRVPAGWTPYRDGHWSWIEPWGWTWVDDAPWGYAPSHYGRWARVDRNWAWVPGPVRSRPVYAPAVVQFVGGPGPRDALTVAGIAAVAWFALAPHEIYRPPYVASRQYLTAVNASNTVVRTTNITNVNITNVYIHQRGGGLVAVPTSAFVNAQPVARARVNVNPEATARTRVAATAVAAPVLNSLTGGAAAASGRPPAARGQERRVIAKVAPPPAPAPFAARQQALAERAGQPLERQVRRSPAPATTTAGPAVRVVTATAPPTPLPVRAPDSARAATERTASDRTAAAASVPARPGEAPRTEQRRGSPPPAPAAVAGARTVPGVAPVPPTPGRAASAAAAPRAPVTAQARPEAASRPGRADRPGRPPQAAEARVEPLPPRAGPAAPRAAERTRASPPPAAPAPPTAAAPPPVAPAPPTAAAPPPVAPAPPTAATRPPVALAPPTAAAPPPAASPPPTPAAPRAQRPVKPAGPAAGERAAAPAERERTAAPAERERTAAPPGRERAPARVQERARPPAADPVAAARPPAAVPPPKAPADAERGKDGRKDPKDRRRDDKGERV